MNYEVDRYIRSKNDNDFVKRKQWVRLGGLYMVFKTWRKGYNDRRHIREQMLTDRQLMEAESNRQDALRFPKLQPRFFGPDDPLLKELEETYGSDPTSGNIIPRDDLPTILSPDESNV